MRRLIFTGAISLMTVAGSACSSGTGDGGGGGGNPNREFVSGDLANGASFSHTFTGVGTIPYYCRYHGAAGGVGMSGVITVAAAQPGYTPVNHQLSITTSTLPDVSIQAGDQVTWTNNHSLVHTVESDN